MIIHTDSIDRYKTIRCLNKVTIYKANKLTIIEFTLATCNMNFSAIQPN
jgi:hypothetical protein